MKAAHHQPTKRTVGMDMVAPFGVYLDGEEVGQYDTEAEAQAHFERLATAGKGRGPAANAEEARA